MNFTPGFDILKKDKPEGYWFLFYEGRLLLAEKESGARIPFAPNIEDFGFNFSDCLYIGFLKGQACYGASLIKGETLNGFFFAGLRQVYDMVDEEWFWIASRAFHLLNWVEKNKFCGCCGSPLVGLAEEHALKCCSCGQIIYPRISPAVIVAIIKERQILLARSSRFASAMYSVLAGFVEPGESLEECVKREIREEAGIEVKDIKYFASQPWPFPDSLMVGFTARYAAGEITVDNKEIVEAAWFTADNLPEIPAKVSIARRLIDWFVWEYKNGTANEH